MPWYVDSWGGTDDGVFSLEPGNRTLSEIPTERVDTIELAKRAHMYRNILVPLDGSEEAECVLPHLEEIVRGHNVENVILLRVVEPLPTSVGADYIFSEEITKQVAAEHTRDAETYLSRLADKLRHLGVNLSCEVVSGRAAESISDYAAHHPVDLIIMATHGLSGIGRWLMGSVADRVLHSSCVPILLVRAPGCVPHI